MKYTLILISASSLVLSSCSNLENVESKMSRYTPKTGGKNLVPEFEIGDVTVNQGATKSRAPASVEEKSPNKSKSASKTNEVSEDDVNVGLSNKKLYFMALYNQYESMKGYAHKYNAPEINICPHFHNSLIEEKDKRPTSIVPRTQKLFSYDTEQLKNPDYRKKYPELFLPVTQEDVKPRVIDQMTMAKTPLSKDQVNDLVHSALDVHLAKTYTEIRNLCEFGVSDNYYIYENLITHIKNNEFGPKTENLKTLLKTTIFSNTLLIRSLEKKASDTGRSIASIEGIKNEASLDKKSKYTTEVMKRLNVTWASEFFGK